MSGAQISKKATGSIDQHEHWDDGFVRKVSEGVLAAGVRLDPATLAASPPISIAPGEILRIRVSAQAWIAFSENATALGAATIGTAYNASPVMELNDTTKEYLIAAPPLSALNKNMYVRMSAAPARVEKLNG